MVFETVMPTLTSRRSRKADRTNVPKIVLRYRAADTKFGVTRETTKNMAAKLGVNETAVIHMALRALAREVLTYEADDGEPSDAMMMSIRTLALADLVGERKPVGPHLFEGSR